ncbi:hypothetical protein [Roseomonas populi]|uniref:Uncharacterized protein n=1 Tax=Roseomonas populi TaxID=3121582 RepID=A0ABT1WXY3_9PROT|nr:hypothetical protein [Roseomonas pecuniae]MCR0980706.1 hypothetical protein [Roseomonas pecuniae]
MTTPPGSASGITRVLEMRDSARGTRTVAVEFETGSGSGAVIVTVDAAGKLSFNSVFRDPASVRPPSSAKERPAALRAPTAEASS